MGVQDESIRWEQVWSWNSWSSMLRNGSGLFECQMALGRNECPGLAFDSLGTVHLLIMFCSWLPDQRWDGRQSSHCSKDWVSVGYDSLCCHIHCAQHWLDPAISEQSPINYMHVTEVIYLSHFTLCILLIIFLRTPLPPHFLLCAQSSPVTVASAYCPLYLTMKHFKHLPTLRL